MASTENSWRFLIAIIAVAAVATTAVATAQSSQLAAQIVWLDDPSEVTVLNGADDAVEPDFGDLLRAGAIIETGASTVELVLVPNGAVIIIDAETIFQIDHLPGDRRGRRRNQNAFSLTSGKLRIVAGQNIGESYSVRTPTAVAGVRGTDFYRMYVPDQGTDWLCVTDGAVEFRPPRWGRGVLVPAGMFVNLNEGFETQQPSEDWLRTNLTLEELRGAELPPNS